MRFFYDTEFIEDGLTIDLVSIGVVDEKGREFYAVSTDFDPGKAGPWVRENVLPKLPSPADTAWRNREQIRTDLLERGFTVLGKTDCTIQAGQVCLDQLSIGCSVVNYQYDRHPQAASHHLLSDSRIRNCNLGPLS